ncbi:unnamed protein product [Phytomonas sp. Hart1]|nr:unnamed protein product [Phytomonas sp. Hart1]|eukprot:CCW69164.1 unnamed protein product [Phytomonas sp. isolate Hart1]
MNKGTCTLTKGYYSSFHQLLPFVSIPNAKQPPQHLNKARRLRFRANVQDASNQLTQSHQAMLTFDQKCSMVKTIIPAAKAFQPNSTANVHINAKTIQKSLQCIYPPNPIVYLGVVHRCTDQSFTKSTIDLKPHQPEATSKAETHDDIKQDVELSESEARGERVTTRCAVQEEDVWILRQGSRFCASRLSFVVFPVVPQHLRHTLGLFLQPLTLLSSAFTGTNQPIVQENALMPLPYKCSPDMKESLCLSSPLHSDKFSEISKSHLRESESHNVSFLSDLLQCVFSPVVRNSLSPYLKNILTDTGVNPSKVNNRSENGADNPTASTPCAHQNFHLPFSRSFISPASYVDIRQGKFGVDSQRLWELSMTTMRQRAPSLVLVDERESVFPPSGKPGIGVDDNHPGKPWRRVRFQVEPTLWMRDRAKGEDRDVLPTVSLPTTSFDMAVYTERMPLDPSSHAKLLSDLSKSQRKLVESRRPHLVDADNSPETTQNHTANATTTSPKESTHMAWVWNGSFWVEEVDPQLSRVAYGIFDRVQRIRSSGDTHNDPKHLSPPAIPQQLVAWVPSFWWEFRSLSAKPSFFYRHRAGGACTRLEPLLQFTIELRKTWTVTGLEGIRELIIMTSMRLRNVLKEKDSCWLPLIDESHKAGEMLVESKKPPNDTKLLMRQTDRMKKAEKTLTVASLFSSSISPFPTSLSVLPFEDTPKSSLPLDDSHDEPVEVVTDGDRLFMKSTHPHSSSFYLLNSSRENLSSVYYPAYNALSGMPLDYKCRNFLNARNKKPDIRGDVPQVVGSRFNESTRPSHSTKSVETRSLKFSEGLPNPFDFSFSSQQICWVPKEAIDDLGLQVARDGLGSEKGVFEQPRVRELVETGEPLMDAKATLQREVHYTGFPFHQLPLWITSLIPSTDSSANYPRAVADSLTGMGTPYKSPLQKTLIRTLLEYSPSPISGCLQWHCNPDRKEQIGGNDDSTVWVLQYDPSQCLSPSCDPGLTEFLPVQGLLWKVYRVIDTKMNFIFSISDILQSVGAREEKAHPESSGYDSYDFKTEANLIRSLLHSVFEERCRMHCSSFQALRLSSELEKASYFFLDIRAALLLLEILKSRKGSLQSSAVKHSTNGKQMDAVDGKTHHTGFQPDCSCVLSDIETPLNRTSDQDWLEECEEIWSKHSSSWSSKKGIRDKGACGTEASFADASTRWFLSPSSFVDYCVTRCKRKLFWKLEELDAALSLAASDSIIREDEQARSRIGECGLYSDCAELQSTAALPLSEELVGEAGMDDRCGPDAQTSLPPQEETFLGQFAILRDDDGAEDGDIKHNRIHPASENLNTLEDFPAVDRRYFGPGSRLFDALIHPKLSPDRGVKDLLHSALGLERANAILNANKVARCTRQLSPYSCLSQDHYDGKDNIFQTSTKEACMEKPSHMLDMNTKFFPTTEDIEETIRTNTSSGQGVPTYTFKDETPSFRDIYFPGLTCVSQVEVCIAEEQNRLQKRWSPWLKLFSKQMPGEHNNDSRKSNDVQDELPLSVPLSPLARMLCTLGEMESTHTRSFEAPMKPIQNDKSGSMVEMVTNEAHQTSLSNGLCCWDLGLTVISISYKEHYVNASNLSFSNLERDK